MSRSNPSEFDPKIPLFGPPKWGFLGLKSGISVPQWGLGTRFSLHFVRKTDFQSWEVKISLFPYFSLLWAVQMGQNSSNLINFEQFFSLLGAKIAYFSLVSRLVGTYLPFDGLVSNEWVSVGLLACTLCTPGVLQT